MSTFQAPAILTRIAYTKDGGLSLGFATNELRDEDKIIAARFHNKFGYLLFKENEYTDADIPDTDAPDEDKSPSQRLRAVLFVAWKQKGSRGEFESFYRRHMDKITDRIKAALDD